MDERTREWQSRPWCVAVCATPYDGTVLRCRNLIRALFTVLTSRLIGWRRVLLFRAGTRSPQDALTALQATMAPPTQKGTPNAISPNDPIE